MITLVRFLLGFMLVFTSLFLILLVLIQRGRGGGLAGALGGMGGQSAFGTKAGDVFTKITVGVAALWIGLCIAAINVLGRQQSLFSSALGGAAPQAVAPAAEGMPPEGAGVDEPAAETASQPDTGQPRSGQPESGQTSDPGPPASEPSSEPAE